MNFGGKLKAVTFSYDDGVTQDERLIKLFDKYGLKCTFNINHDLIGHEGSLIREGVKVNHTKIDASRIRSVYEGHEVASHSLTHPYFSSLTEEEVIRQVKDDVKNLTEIFGYRVEGFAFPFHDQTEENIATVKENVDLSYIRYSYLDHSGAHRDRYHIHINALYDDEDIYERLEEFKADDSSENSLFVIAGHAYEFEVKNDWEKIEKLLSYLKNDDAITVLTLRDAVKILFPI